MVMKLNWIKFFVLFVLLFSWGEVSALSNDSHLDLDPISGIYFIQQSDKGIRSAEQAMFYVNGKIAYCIEPGVTITSDTYSSYPGLESSGFSDEVNRYLELVGYYGYEYPGHQSTLFYLATQELIWEKVKPIQVSWDTQKSGGGTSINVDLQKAEILALIERDPLKPTFASTSSKGNLGSQLILHDANGVFSNYMLKERTDRVTLNSNTLTVRLDDKQVVKDTYHFVRKNYDAGTTFVYKSPGSQTFGVLRLSIPQEIDVSVESLGGTVSLQKFGEEFGVVDQGYKYEEMELSAVEFQLLANEDINPDGGIIQYKKGDVVREFKTDEHGKWTSDILPLGEYCVKEVKTEEHHVLAESLECFKLTEKEQTKELVLKNVLKKGSLEFLKYDLSSRSPLANVEIEVYTKTNNLVYRGKTNEQGQIILPQLVLGDYYILEKEALPGYELNTKKHYFSIEQNGQVVKKEMANQKKVAMPSTYNTEKKFNYIFVTLLVLGSGLILLAWRYAKR